MKQYTELVKDPRTKYLHTLAIVTTEGESVSLIYQSRQLLRVCERGVVPRPTWVWCSPPA